MRFAHRCAVLAGFAFAFTIAPAGAASLGGERWARPVDGPVARAFDPPATPFGAGHLGVDFAVAPATPVRAAGNGVVVFAGRVGAGLHVVIRHDGEIRTSYSFLAGIAVVVGQPVQRGETIGTSGGTGPGHGAGVVHFGVRVGADYVDPLRLFTPADLAAVVHLAAPHGGPAGPPVPEHRPSPAAGERVALAAEIRVDARPSTRPPAWWNESRAEPMARPSAPGSPRRPVATRPAPSQRGARSRGAAEMGVAALSVGGLAALRRRRLGRDRSRGGRLHSDPAR